MINLELSEAHQGTETFMHEVAKNVFRPISRKYDKQEPRTHLDDELS